MEGAPAGQKHIAAVIGGEAVPSFLQARLSVIRLSGVKSILLLPYFVLRLYSLCKKNRIDILHAHHRYFDIAGSMAGRLLGIPVVTTVHSKVRSLRHFSYFADSFIAPGENIKSHLMNTFRIPGEKITVLHNFVSAEDYAYTQDEIKKIREKYRIPENRTIILFAGRMSKEKGVDILVDSMRKLMHTFSDVFLILAGDGEERSSIKKFCDTHLVNVAIIEPLHGIGALYALADIVVLPSRVDPFPLVMLEAGLMKKTFLGTRVDGIAEVIKHKVNGYLIEPGSRQALISGLTELLSDSALRGALAENHFTVVQESYLHTGRLKQYNDFYFALLNRSHHGAE